MIVLNACYGPADDHYDDDVMMMMIITTIIIMLLFITDPCVKSINRILGDKLVVIFQKYPSLVSTHQQELMEFITGFKNLGTDKEHVFINLVTLDD